jgi:hypothetical protein
VNGPLIADAVFGVGSLGAIAATLLVGLVFVMCRLVSRYRRADQEKPPLPPEPAMLTAVLDLEPGRNLALRDECQRLWSMPAYGEVDLDDLDARLDRLRAAIRDEQHKQGD